MLELKQAPSTAKTIASGSQEVPVVVPAGMTLVCEPVTAGTGYMLVDHTFDGRGMLTAETARWVSSPRGPVGRKTWRETFLEEAAVRLRPQDGAFTYYARPASATERNGDRRIICPPGTAFQANDIRSYALKYAFGATNTSTIIPPDTFTKTASGGPSVSTSGGSLTMTQASAASKRRGFGSLWDSANQEFDLFGRGLWQTLERLSVLVYIASGSGATGKYIGLGMNSFLGEAGTEADPPADAADWSAAGNADQAWYQLRAHLSATPAWEFAGYGAPAAGQTVKVLNMTTSGAIAAPVLSGKMYHLELINRPGDSVAAYVNGRCGGAITDTAHMPDANVAVRAYGWELFGATGAAAAAYALHWHALEHEFLYDLEGAA